MSLKSDLKKCRANISSKGMEKLQTNFANYCQETFKECKDRQILRLISLFSNNNT